MPVALFAQIFPLSILGVHVLCCNVCICNIRSPLQSVIPNYPLSVQIPNHKCPLIENLPRRRSFFDLGSTKSVKVECINHVSIFLGYLLSKELVDRPIFVTHEHHTYLTHSWESYPQVKIRSWMRRQALVLQPRLSCSRGHNMQHDSRDGAVLNSS